MADSLDDIYDYDRGLLAEALGYDQSFIDKFFLDQSIRIDEAFQTGAIVTRNIFLVTSILGLISNTFCVVLLATMKGPLKTSMKLLLSLSLSDAVRSSLDVTLYFYRYDTVRYVVTTDRSISGKDYIIRRLLTSLYILADLSSLLTTVFFAIVIFLAVKNPLSYKTLMSKRRGNGMVFLIWITGVLLTILFNSVLEGKKYSAALTAIPTAFVELELFSSLFLIYNYIVDAILFIILGLNITIFVQVNASMMKSVNDRRLNRLAVVLLLISLCFFMTSLPIIPQVLSASFTMKEHYTNKFVLYFLSYVPLILQGLRSFGNSLVYTVRLPEIQEQFINIFCSQRSKSEKNKQEKRNNVRQGYRQKFKRTVSLNSYGNETKSSTETSGSTEISSISEPSLWHLNTDKD